MNNLGTKTIEDILGDTFNPKQKAIFLLKQKLAFYHPMRPDILVFLGGEMPHLVKKIVNALENSGTKPTRDLILKTKRLSLNRLRVRLAAQVTQQTPLRLINLYAKKCVGHR